MSKRPHFPEGAKIYFQGLYRLNLHFVPGMDDTLGKARGKAVAQLLDDAVRLCHQSGVANPDVFQFAPFILRDDVVHRLCRSSAVQMKQTYQQGSDKSSSKRAAAGKQLKTHISAHSMSNLAMNDTKREALWKAVGGNLCKTQRDFDLLAHDIKSMWGVSMTTLFLAKDLVDRSKKAKDYGWLFRVLLLGNTKTAKLRRAQMGKAAFRYSLNHNAMYLLGSGAKQTVLWFLGGHSCVPNCKVVNHKEHGRSHFTGTKKQVQVVRDVMVDIYKVFEIIDYGYDAEEKVEPAKGKMKARNPCAEEKVEPANMYEARGVDRGLHTDHFPEEPDPYADQFAENPDLQMKATTLPTKSTPRAPRPFFAPQEQLFGLTPDDDYLYGN